MDNYVYFMASGNGNALYVGVTSDLARRVWEHKNGIDEKRFSYKYKCHKLVYYEEFRDIGDAIAREKQLKNWKREWKDELIREMNPNWVDLSEGGLDCGSGPAMTRQRSSQ